MKITQIKLILLVLCVDIKMKNVDFKYQNSHEYIFKNINLKLKKVHIQ